MSLESTDTPTPASDKHSHNVKSLELNQSSQGNPRELSKKELFANQLGGELPICPECSKILRNRSIEKCDYCGFSYRYLQKFLPTEHLPILTPVLDLSKKLTDTENRGILKVINYISKRYPQVSPKVCLIPLQADIKIHQMALWMLNQCPLAESETAENKHWQILLLIDTSNNISALSYGYHIEKFIPDESASKLISKLNRSLRKGDASSPVEELLQDILSILDTSKRTTKRLYRKFKKQN